MRYAKPNKYNASSQVYNGRRYDSKLEASYAMQLDWMKKAGEIESWDSQHKWELYVKGKKICQYSIDFRVINNDGWIDYVEIKGYPNYAFHIRWNLVQALFEDLVEGENARLFLNDKVVLTKYLTNV